MISGISTKRSLIAIPKKFLLTPKIPSSMGDGPQSEGNQVNLLAPDESKSFCHTSGIREDPEFLTVTKAAPVQNSNVSWNRFIMVSSNDQETKFLSPNCNYNLSTSSISREKSSSNHFEGSGSQPKLDTNIDYEELLKQNPDFNKYYEERQALQRKKTIESEKKTPLHAALGMPFAAKVSRSELRSFEKLL